jgi:hypothetical protein
MKGDEELDRCGSGGPPTRPPGAATPPVLAALERVRGIVARVAEDRCWSLSDDEVDTALAGVVAARAQLDHLSLRLLAAAGKRGLGGIAGSASMATWWAGRSGRTRAAAASDVRLAAALDTEERRLISAAMAAGVLSVEQAEVVDKALARLPPLGEITAEHQADAEAFLVHEGAGAAGTDRLRECAAAGDAAPAVVPAGPLGLGPKELGKLGRRLFDVIDPDRADAQEGRLLELEEARARQLTWLRMRSNGDGTTLGSFRLPDAQADMLRTVLEGYASPRRQRRGGGDPASGDAATLDRRPGKPSGAAGRDTDGRTSPENDAVAVSPRYEGIHAAGLGAGAFRPGEADTTPTTLRYDQRLGLALCELMEHVPVDSLPQAGGLAATITVTLDFAHLLDGLGAAPLSTGTTISAGQARRLACGAGIVPVVLGSDSVPLDVGREHRLYERYGRLAMATRDGGCVFPDCDRPAAWCEAHHLTPWSRGGRTDAGDGCLLCSFHHHLIHQGQWEARMGADGIPEVLPPARVDPARAPRRHVRFRCLTTASRRR